MTREEYIKEQHVLGGKWSKPKFECPKCGKNSVCMDTTVVLTCYPPKHRYECRKEYDGCGEYFECL